MRGSLFHHAVGSGTERFSLQNPQILAVRLGRETGHEVLARKGAMVAFQGGVEFDGHHLTPRERQVYQYTGEQLNLMRCHGTGTVYLAHQAQYLCILDIAQDGLVVDGDYILAFDPQLSWNVVAIESQESIAATGAYNMELRGHGRVALMTSGKPLVMRVGPQSEAFADADAVIAWSAGLTTRMEAQTTSSRVWRRRRGTGEGWTMCFLGDGFVVVQPHELAGPARFQAGGGPLGMGSGGYRGNQWGG